MNWTEWKKWVNWNEWSETKKSKLMNWNERSEVSFTFCRPRCPKVVPTRQFFAIFMWNRALATVSCTFCRPHLQKVWSETGSFFSFFYVNQALPTASCTFCRPLSGSRRAPVETDTLQLRPRTATLHEKTLGFAPESVFSRELTRSRSLTSWWRCDWHDDVVDMMVRQLAIDNRPKLGSFLTKLPLIILCKAMWYKMIWYKHINYNWV